MLEEITIARTMLVGSSKPIKDVVFSLDSDLIATCAADIGIRVYHAVTHHMVASLYSEHAIDRVAFTRDSQHLLALTYFEGLFVFETYGGVNTHRPLTCAAFPANTKFVNFSYDALTSTIAVVLEAEGVNRVVVGHVDIENAEIVDAVECSIRSIPSKITAVQIIPGHRVALGTARGDVFVFFNEDGELDTQLDRDHSTIGDGREVVRMAVSADCTQLVVPGRNGTAQVFRTDDLSPIPFSLNDSLNVDPWFAAPHPHVPLIVLGGGLVAAQAATDAAAEDAYNVHFYDRVFWTQLGSISGPKGTLNCGVWDTTGTCLAVGCEDGTILVYKFPADILNYEPQCQ